MAWPILNLFPFIRSGRADEAIGLVCTLLFALAYIYAQQTKYSTISRLLNGLGTTKWIWA